MTRGLLRPAISGVALLLLFSATPVASRECSRYFAQIPGKIRATLVLEAAPLVTMQEIPFELRIVDAGGKAVTGLMITSDMSMPAMPMPPNNPPVLPHDDRYHGTVVFTMAGAWLATFTVTPAQGRPFPLAFDIPSVLLK